MATRKKTKKKAKKAAKKKSAARKKKVAKKARRPVVRAKAKAKKKVTRPKRKVAAKPKAAPKKAKPAALAAKPAAAVPANEERIGIVTHYYTHLGVAIIQLETGMLREGETVHIKGHTSDFMQPVGSMEVNHVHVNLTRAGESFGLKVREHAREHDVVYRVKSA